MWVFKIAPLILCLEFFASSSAAILSALETGCQNFVGLARCEDGSPILPFASVALYEVDVFADTLLHEESLIPSENLRFGSFSWRSCYKNGLFFLSSGSSSSSEQYLYLKFSNVCTPGDSYIAADIAPEDPKIKNFYLLQYGKAFLFRQRIYP